ncbi:hypothetical protein AMAG_07484 [Allomyces macrogynus ATCC 38327]|uniref:Uncharacterized protein n=1 Tax=Allomyces macrogynus (strain ATCC 38327) TaxID=578462 RepID=A0A0L0SIA2_ALLM3|nr:hypothetical protein AMAG_07484 [Allomyces macrogynus ATCC 38327]|eukprot:KNE62246.1 hypothetical protein AMAG_07484 [Allomyces macrogynus ATCC 38327]
MPPLHHASSSLAARYSAAAGLATRPAAPLAMHAARAQLRPHRVATLTTLAARGSRPSHHVARSVRTFSTSPPPADPAPATARFGVREALLMAAVVGMGIGAGAVMAQSFAQALAATGLFTYVPDDDDDNDDDGDDDDDDEDAGVTTRAQPAPIVELTTDEELAAVRRKLAVEAAGDLTLNVTVNLRQWDQPARAFQLLQLQSFLDALNDAAKVSGSDDDDAATAAEVALVRQFATDMIAHLESRMPHAPGSVQPPAIQNVIGEKEGEGKSHWRWW